MSALCLPGIFFLKSEMQFATVQEPCDRGKHCSRFQQREKKAPTARGGHVGGSQQRGVGQSSGLLAPAPLCQPRGSRSSSSTVDIAFYYLLSANCANRDSVTATYCS